MIWSVISGIGGFFIGGILGLCIGVYITALGAIRTGKLRWGDKTYRVIPESARPSGYQNYMRDEDIVSVMKKNLSDGVFDAEIGRVISRNEARKNRASL